MNRRVGIFGGSFDPPHDAHVALAVLARNTLRLDELRLVPVGDAWQKTARPLTPGPMRLDMLHLAFDRESRMRIDEIELNRVGPSYTIDTVDAFQAEALEAGSDWYLVIGQDQYEHFHTWHRWQELAARVTLAVAGRAGHPPRPGPELAAVPHRAVTLPLPPMALSASDVRASVVAGTHIENSVPRAVARYIEREHLYRS